MKNYVITGSIGHISKPIAEHLIEAGKNVTIITSDVNKVNQIEALGAEALIGSLEDSQFVQDAFKNAEVVYTMIPPLMNTNDLRGTQLKIASNYAESIRANKIPYVVTLSSIGAHMGNGCGPVDSLSAYEKMLDQIPGLNVKHLRPSYFFYNLFNQIGLIKNMGIAGGNFGNSNLRLPLVHTNDIAAAATEELLYLNFQGSSFRYVVSDFRTTEEIVQVLSKAIGKKFSWVEFTDDQQKEGLLNAGLSVSHADAFTEMGIAMRTGKMFEDLYKHHPTLSPAKLENFASEFSLAYNAF
ncbi:NmrA family protein [Sporocytophaga myxococcoides]|uniref:NmrA family protein n=1 Tax=Sporocytophaga myxococcoides TaxID=153721 RepID=A0A098LIV2_9BACT|nr:NmrA family NAD(P)-binding protein [Sporocytophaga myxococcoides]GAL86098.1 NmrA family protein [Sporocytophaga myxococcoides]